MAEITALKRPSDPSGVVKLLEELLAEAREGKLECLVTVTFAPRVLLRPHVEHPQPPLYPGGARPGPTRCA